jgi:hypothetical protein
LCQKSKVSIIISRLDSTQLNSTQLIAMAYESGRRRHGKAVGYFRQ